MSILYTCVCHTCRVYTPFENYTFEYANKFFEAFNKRHIGHTTKSSNDYDYELDYILEGWKNIEYTGYDCYKVSDKGEPYQIISDEEIEEIAREVEWPETV